MLGPCSKCGKPKTSPGYCPDCQREYNRAWRVANAEAVREYNKAWREANPQYGPEYMKLWRAANPQAWRGHKPPTPEAKRAKGQRRRAAKKSTQIERFIDTEIFDRDGWRCHICKRPVSKDAPSKHPMSVSLDHIVPLSKGGTHTRDNVACSHLKCNLRKYALLGRGVQPLLIG